MVQKIFPLLICSLLMSLSFLSNIQMGYASENSQTNETNAESSYYLIHYNGEKQEIGFNEETKLLLTGWADDAKSTVSGAISGITNDQEEKILQVSQGLNELPITENMSIYYRVIVSGEYKTELVTSLELNEHSTVIEKNENGTSIEEQYTIDQYDTLIKNHELVYYVTDENSQKIMITSEEYDVINAVKETTSVPAVNQSSVDTESIKATAMPSVVYSTHVQNYGWLSTVSDGKMSGTSGESKRMEAIKISLKNSPYSGDITYKTHVQNYGWLSPVSNGALSGTSGESKRMEAIQINLTGDMAQYYDIYYRVHAQTYGWLGWAKNGQSAGTQGLSKRLEAIEVVLVQKGASAPGATDQAFILDPSVSYTTHVQGYGWLKPVSDGKMSGTSGQSKRLEAIKISLKNLPYSGAITYKTHIEKYGWLHAVSNGALSGTSGESKRMEAIQLSLTGEMAKYYDIYYRVHAQTYGWLDWAKNGQSAGTEALSKRLEAIEIVLVEKGGTAPGATTRPFVKPSLISTNIHYNLTLNEALNMQMKASTAPQTDKYRNDPGYVSSQYLEMYDGGSITGTSVNLRTSPILTSDDNIAVNVGLGTAFLVLDKNVTGDVFSDSTLWYKIEYKGQVLYVHSSLSKIHSRVGRVTADQLVIRAEKNATSHVYGSAPKGTLLTVLEEDPIGWFRVGVGAWRNAKAADVQAFLNPINFINDEKQRLQFMNLTKPSDVPVSTLDKYLSGKGILANQGKAFIDAGNIYGINEVYLMAHTLLETGHGTSTLAKGVLYNGKTVYNMYGIGAYDACPLECGAKTAYEKGWFTPYQAIVGGAAFISDKYLRGNNSYNIVQNTLYEMRWNPEMLSTNKVAGHQYATDIGWAAKQVNTMYELYKLEPYTIYLEIPVYK
ncbi:glucosaminidase domain-containing protein [Litchfieldia salsa]|nr:glucosaminidase domain-containing protein [Litchfieldia salsa]